MTKQQDRLRALVGSWLTLANERLNGHPHGLCRRSEDVMVTLRQCADELNSLLAEDEARAATTNHRYDCPSDPDMPSPSRAGTAPLTTECCGAPLHTNSRYCPRCGQEARVSLVSQDATRHEDDSTRVDGE